MIGYPRLCAECNLLYAHRSSFSRHFSSGKCKSTQAGSRTIIHNEKQSSRQIINAENVTMINQDAKLIEEKLELQKKLDQEKLELQKKLDEMKAELEIYKLQEGREPKKALTDIIYILQTRHSFAADMNVFKVGKTKNMSSRLGGYPKGSHVIAQFACINADVLETKLLQKLRATFKERKDFGAEYFECHLRQLLMKVAETYTEFEEGAASY